MVTIPRQPATEGEYLAFERAVPIKHEFVDGRILTLSLEGRDHNRICLNLYRILGTQMLDGPCETYPSPMRLKIAARTIYTYADATVVCGPQEFEERDRDTLLNPTIIIEVLSPSTEAYDRGAKITYYQDLPSLQEYVIIAQDQPRVEHFVRAGATWVLTVTKDLAASVPLPAAGCTLPLSEVYERVGFEPPWAPGRACAKSPASGKVGEARLSPQPHPVVHRAPRVPSS